TKKLIYMSEDENKLSNIRNIGIMAHIDAGKTTTTERILYHCKKIWKMGEVHDKEEHQINIIDTPGHVDFTAEVERSLRVLDGGIVVMDGKKGVEAQTETVWRQAKKYNVPRIIFINKMDGVENEEKFVDNLKSIREKLGVEPLPIQFPIGAGRELKGIVDIIEQKAYYYHQLGDKEKAKEEEYQVKEIPSHLVERTKKYRHELVEKIGKVIEQNEELLLKHLEGHELSVEEIKKMLRQATLTGEYFPVFCGSAYKHVGVKLLLDGVVDYLPSPLDVGEIPTFSLLDKNKEGSINCNSPLPYLALVFKIVFDDRNQRVTFIRVYAGKISAGSQIYNVNQGKEERIRSLVRMHANIKEGIEKVEAGDIAAIIGLEYAITGDTFGDRKNPLLLEAIDFAEPVISQAIEPRTNKDKDKLRDALENLKVQDPSFKYRMDRETGQMIIAGMGELHLEVSVERLRKEYKLDIESKQQKVSYRETITKKLANIEG
ncbi:10054_t:CDS:2, partial [Funneliformis geosporum]